MAKIGRITNQTGTDVSYAFDCPGCGIGHSFRVAGSGPKWTFNGDVDNPTFTPSLLVTWPDGGESRRCHSFVRDGNIQFLNDCWHHLAGKTIPLPETDWGD